MPCGISSATEEIPKRNKQILSDIPWVRAIEDDIIIAIPNEKEHDAVLHQAMERTLARNVT